MRSTFSPVISDPVPVFHEFSGVVRKHLQRTIVVTALAALVGCSSVRLVVDMGAAGRAAPANWNQMLSPNDALTVTRTDGTQLKIHLTAVTGTSLDGVDDRTAAKVSVALGDVSRIERREFDGLKTAFVVVALAAGLYAFAKASSAAAWSSSATL